MQPNYTYFTILSYTIGLTFNESYLYPVKAFFSFLGDLIIVEILYKAHLTESHLLYDFAELRTVENLILDQAVGISRKSWPEVASFQGEQQIQLAALFGGYVEQVDAAVLFLGR